MNRKFFGARLWALPIGIIGALGAGGCQKLQQASEDVCGPCGNISQGDFSVSGNAKLDGFFQAVGTLQSAVLKVQGDFDANIRALAAVYGVTLTGAVDGAAVDSVVAAIQSDISSNLQGGLQVVYKPPACQASVDVAVEAQAKCEAQAGCNVNVQPGQASVQCSGSCSGTCSGTCSGNLSCAVKAPTVDCSGECEGTCELSGAAACNGVCHGTCSGTCSARDATGQCNGTCSGTCQGSCELSARAQCTGTCHGTCYVNQSDPQCTGSVECSGQCDAQCTGSCTGNFTPPSASASCQASADCQAQAKAQASASVDCTPPSLDLTYTFAAGVTASDQAAFTARLAELKVRGAAILQGAARLSALIDGKVNGQTVFDPAPVVQLTTSVTGLVGTAVSGSFDIPKGRLACVGPAFEEAGTVLASIKDSVTVTLTGQAKFAAVFNA